MHSEFLKGWFGKYAGRELGCPQRFYTDSSKEFVKFVEMCRSQGKPCFMSVQPFNARDQVYGLEKLFFDFDSKEDPSKAWNEVIIFVEVLIKHYQVLPLTVFSGNKGYHVYVFLKRTVAFPTQRQDFIKRVYGTLQQMILKGLKFKNLDRNVIGDIKRLARVPFSIHEKTGKVCHPVNLNGKLYVSGSLEIYRNYGRDTSLIEKVIQKIENMKNKKTIWRNSISILNSRKVRPCIEAALKQPLEGEAGHKMRLAVAVEFLNKGYGIEQVVDLFRGQEDFKESRTRYYVEDAKKKRYKPFKCNTIMDLGFCLKEKCKIYRKISLAKNP